MQNIRRFSFFLWIGVVFSTGAFADKKSDVPPCVTEKLMEEPITLDKIDKFFQEEKVRTSEDRIDAFICCLPETFRSEPPYVFKPRGQQKGDIRMPRTLLTNKNGDPIISFSGLSDTLEISKLEKDSSYSFKDNALLAIKKGHPRRVSLKG